MKALAVRIFVLTLCLAPATTFAHPGHADGAPLLHSLAHGAFYLGAVISVAVLAAQTLRRTLRSKQMRIGNRDNYRQ
jgi:hypothetical protein